MFCSVASFSCPFLLLNHLASTALCYGLVCLFSHQSSFFLSHLLDSLPSTVFRAHILQPWHMRKKRFIAECVSNLQKFLRCLKWMCVIYYTCTSLKYLCSCGFFSWAEAASKQQELQRIQSSPGGYLLDTFWSLVSVYTWDKDEKWIIHMEQSRIKHWGMFDCANCLKMSSVILLIISQYLLNGNLFNRFWSVCLIHNNLNWTQFRNNKQRKLILF